MSTWSVQDLVTPNGSIEQNFRITESILVENIILRFVKSGTLRGGATFTFGLYKDNVLLAEKSTTSTLIEQALPASHLFDISIPLEGVFLGADDNEVEYTVRVTTSNYQYADNGSPGYIAVLNRTPEDTNFVIYGTAINADELDDGEAANFTPLWIEFEVIK